MAAQNEDRRVDIKKSFRRAVAEAKPFLLNREGRVRSASFTRLAATSYTAGVSWNFLHLPMWNDAGSDPEDLETYTRRSLEKPHA